MSFIRTVPLLKNLIRTAARTLARPDWNLQGCSRNWNRIVWHCGNRGPLQVMRRETWGCAVKGSDAPRRLLQDEATLRSVRRAQM
jgi:hypothetical protein